MYEHAIWQGGLGTLPQRACWRRRKWAGRTRACSRRRDCHSADTPSPSLLKHLLKVEGVQQNDSLAESYLLGVGPLEHQRVLGEGIEPRRACMSQ